MAPRQYCRYCSGSTGLAPDPDIRLVGNSHTAQTGIPKRIEKSSDVHIREPAGAEMPQSAVLAVCDLQQRIRSPGSLSGRRIIKQMRLAFLREEGSTRLSNDPSSLSLSLQCPSLRLPGSKSLSGSNQTQSRPAFLREEGSTRFSKVSL